MKATRKIIIFVLTFLALVASAYPQSPRAQLQQMVEQLQKNPGDNALREKVIALAAELKPAPAVPEDARRAFIRGNTAFASAKDPAGFSRAIERFEEASALAPWWADPYFNLAKAYEGTQDFDRALRALKYFRATATTEADNRQAMDLTYALEEKRDLKKADAASASAAADETARKKAKTLIVPGVGIGEVQIGMLDSQVIAALGAPSSRERVFGGGGQEYFHYNGKLRITLLPDRKVSSVNSFHRDFVTSEGIGFGSSKSEVSSAMGFPGRTEAADGRLVWYYPQRGVSFGFTNPQSFSQVNYVDVSKPW